MAFLERGKELLGTGVIGWKNHGHSEDRPCCGVDAFVDFVAFLVILSTIQCPRQAQGPFLFPAGNSLAETILVSDLRNASSGERLLAITLQGKINSMKESQIYLLLAEWDLFWLDRLREKGYIRTTVEADLQGLLDRYGDIFDTAVVPDDHVPATINVATMMAALSNAIVVEPQCLDLLAGEKRLEDLRGRWQRDVDAYRWAKVHLWPEMNPKVLACYNPSSCPHFLRDYLVSNKIFTFWITSQDGEDRTVSFHEEEKAFAESLFLATSPPTPILGFWHSGSDPGIHEYTGVGWAGEYGVLTVPCDFATNMSLLSGVRSDLSRAVKHYHARSDAAKISLDQGKVYVAFHVIESGDAPSYWQNRQYKVWEDPVRGSVPIHWSLGPGLLELMPPIAEWFLEHASARDQFFLGISGAAYVHPYRGLFQKTNDPEGLWVEYLSLTGNYLRILGLDAVGLYTDSWKPFIRDSQDPVTLRFAEGIPGIRFLLLGMGRDHGVTVSNAIYELGRDRVMVCHILTRWLPEWTRFSRQEQIDWLVREIRCQTPEIRPAFMNVMALSWVYGPEEIQAVLRGLGDSYQAILLPEMKTLLLEARQLGPLGEK